MSLVHMLKKWSVVLDVRRRRRRRRRLGCNPFFFSLPPCMGAHHARRRRMHLKNGGPLFERMGLRARSGTVLARHRQAAGNESGPHAQKVVHRSRGAIGSVSLVLAAQPLLATSFCAWPLLPSSDSDPCCDSCTLPVATYDARTSEKAKHILSVWTRRIAHRFVMPR